MTTTTLVKKALSVPPSRCACCNRDFAFYRKRHHCHECGADVCKACTTSAHNCPLKVCLTCLVEPTDSQRGREASKRSQRSTSSASSVISSSRDYGYVLDYNWIYPWPKPPMLDNDTERIKIVAALGVLDAPRTDFFESICHLAITTMETAIAVVSVLDKDREWIVDSIGLTPREVPRDASFCAHTARSTEPLVVLDTHYDDRFRENPLVTGSLRVRFYAGWPIVAPSGCIIGAVSVMSDRPRTYCDVAKLQLPARLATALFFKPPGRAPDTVYHISHEFELD
ncbi:hypothetical protein SDRG_08015 [Saprolegnia diclina VS20]|uniref:FYVE-type domain-containing protein n=1 Tax=Saprolegnia diclina (strain VS20) TaxID=1156394 RepID=T0Q9V7_SAPDV|nr:hypothetical protein SDRG_08015 [Saprolegnia diclina VS20]EQC34699.1 hypothetical protein SDRG_08015 [Saprolegnia diclina VS20]|eukprot:XP_008612105.1 hypothetical protein SDRG_08015 [Saprolegnia diclina VS20]